MPQEGVARPEDIDNAFKLGLNHSMGPSTPLVHYVKAGRLGCKSERGMFEYSNGIKTEATAETPE